MEEFWKVKIWSEGFGEWVVKEGYLGIEVSGIKYIIDSREEEPKGPIKKVKRINGEGNIYIKYIIDRENECWVGADELRHVSKEELIKRLEGIKYDSREEREILGMKERLPTWVRSAKEAGWKEPEGWDWGRYENS